MQFTLDSVEHFKACLAEKHKKSVTASPEIIKDLSELFEQKPYTYYFGILTFGKSHEDEHQLSLMEDNDDFISIDENSQIIEFFTHLKYGVNGTKYLDLDGIEQYRNIDSLIYEVEYTKYFDSDTDEEIFEEDLETHVGEYYSTDFIDVRLDEDGSTQVTLEAEKFTKVPYVEPYGQIKGHFRGYELSLL